MFALSYAVLWFCLGLISVKRFRGISAFVRLNGKFLSQVVDLNVRFDIFCWLYCLDQHHTISTSVKAYQRHRDKHTIIDSTPSTPLREVIRHYFISIVCFSSFCGIQCCGLGWSWSCFMFIWWFVAEVLLWPRELLLCYFYYRTWSKKLCTLSQARFKGPRHRTVDDPLHSYIKLKIEGLSNVSVIVVVAVTVIVTIMFLCRKIHSDTSFHVTKTLSIKVGTRYQSTGTRKAPLAGGGVFQISKRAGLPA